MSDDWRRDCRKDIEALIAREKSAEAERRRSYCEHGECPICGSDMQDFSHIGFVAVPCPECGCGDVHSLIEADVFEDSGSKVVVKRGPERVTVVKCVCEGCGHKWSAFYVVKDGRLRLVG